METKVGGGHKFSGRCTQSARLVRAAAAVAVLFSSMALMAGCRGSVTCKTWTARSGTDLAIPIWESCSDDINREIRCERGPTSFECRCIANSVIGKTFQMVENSSIVSDRATATNLANQQCGWDLKLE